MIHYWILDERGEVLSADAGTWAQWLGSANRQVARTVTAGWTVSTVFIGIAAGRDSKGRPRLWETRVFDQRKKSRRERHYGSREEALAGHEAAVATIPHVLQERYDRRKRGRS